MLLLCQFPFNYKVFREIPSKTGGVVGIGQKKISSLRGDLNYIFLNKSDAL